MPDPELLNQQSAAAPQAAAATATPAAPTALPNAPAASVAGASAAPAAAPSVAAAAAAPSVAAAPSGADAARKAKSAQMTGVAKNTKRGRDKSDDTSNRDQAIESIDAAAGVIGDAKDEFGDAYEAMNEAQGKEKDDLSDTVKADMKGVGIASGAMGALSGIKGMADSLQTIMDPDKEALDKAEAAFEMGEGAAGGVGAASDLTNEVASEGSKVAEDSEAVSAYAGGIGDAISSVKTAFELVRGLVAAVKDKEVSSTKEKAIQGLGAAESAVGLAKSTLETINSIKGAIDGGTFGSLAGAIPGLDIALAGISIIKEGVYLVIAYRDYKKVNADKEAQMAKDSGLADSAEVIRVKEADISNLQSVITEDHIKLAKIEAKIPAASDKKGFFGGDSEKEELEAEKADIKMRLITMKAKKAAATKERTELETAKPEALEFALIGEIAEANKKRIVRNSILLVADFANLAGSIANLTGVGAMAGAGLKTASAAVKVALPAARMAKQAGRDSAADAEARGKSTSGIFDTSKSTAAKRGYRMKQVNTLLGQIQGLSKLEGSKFDERAAKLETYISAMGVSPKRLYSKNGDQTAQITMLYKGLIQRE